MTTFWGSTRMQGSFNTKVSHDIIAHRLITCAATWKCPSPIHDHKPLIKGRPTQLEQTLIAQAAFPWQSHLHATVFGMMRTTIISVPGTTATKSPTQQNKLKIT